MPTIIDTFLSCTPKPLDNRYLLKKSAIPYDKAPKHIYFNNGIAVNYSSPKTNDMKGLANSNIHINMAMHKDKRINNILLLILEVETYLLYKTVDIILGIMDSGIEICCAIL